MELVILPGNSISNKEEMEKISDKISPLFNDTYIHYYKHWKENKKMIDIDYEISILKEKLKPKNKLVIFAKSVGIVLALKMIKRYRIKPLGCIFAGTPINWLIDKNIEFESFLKGFNTKSLFIQKKNDPFFSGSDLKKLLKNFKIKNAFFVEIEGNNHDYASPRLLEITKNFIFSLKKKNKRELD